MRDVPPKTLGRLYPAPHDALQEIAYHGRTICGVCAGVIRGDHQSEKQSTKYSPHATHH